MKKIILSSFILIICIFSFSQNLSIIDYYRLLPDSLIHYYEIFYKDNKWYTNSCAEYEIEILVDIKNGYIEINDEGTGGGRTTVKTVLFRKTDGSGLIGISYHFYDGFADSDIKFLEYKNNEWVFVTNEVLPEITYRNFMSDDYELPYFEFPPFSIYYDLPQFGSSIKLTIFYDILKMQCDGEFMEVSKEEKEIACNFVKNIKNENLTLIWDKQNTRFLLK